MTVCRWSVLGMRNVWQKSCRENRNSCFMFSNPFLRKSFRLWNNVENYVGNRLAPDDSTIRRMLFACCITEATDTNTGTCNTYRFSTATIVSRTRLNITLCIHCLSCCLLNTAKSFPLSVLFLHSVCFSYFSCLFSPILMYPAFSIFFFSSHFLPVFFPNLLSLFHLFLTFFLLFLSVLLCVLFSSVILFFFLCPFIPLAHTFWRRCHCIAEVPYVVGRTKYDITNISVFQCVL